MSAVRRWLLRFWTTFRTTAAERELSREVAAHLALLEDDYQREGLTPDEARLAARRAFGGVEQAKELQRETRALAWMDHLRRDVSYACRSLARTPGFTLVAIATLAVGIGATTTVAGLMDALLWRAPEGVRDPASLVTVFADDVETPETEYGAFSYGQYVELRERQQVLTDLAAYWRFQVTLRSETGARHILLDFGSGNSFSLLGLQPALGRLYSEADDRPGAPIVGVLSHRAWQTSFGGSPDVLGQMLPVNDVLVEIIGVAPAGYAGLPLDWYPHPELYLPLQTYGRVGNSNKLERTDADFVAWGRLKPGVSQGEAHAQLSLAASQLEAPFDDVYFNRGAVALRPYSQSRVWPVRRAPVMRLMSLLLGVSVLVLLIGCFNVASFLLGRDAARRHELAVRVALGASRGRVLSQLLTESAVMAVLATLGGLWIAVFLARVLAGVPHLFGRVTLDVGPFLDRRVLLFSVLLAIAATALFALVPAWTSARRAVRAHLQTAGPVRPWVGRRLTLRHALLVLQVGIALSLAVTAGLYVGSLGRMLKVDVGYPVASTLLTRFDRGTMPDHPSRELNRQLLERVRAQPGVAHAAVAALEPFRVNRFEVWIRGQTSPSLAESGFSWAGPGYFETVGIPFVAGRDFTGGDEAAGAAVIINTVLAEQLWPDGDAVGRALYLPGISDTPTARATQGLRDRVVVGVVRVDKCWDPLDDRPQPCMWGVVLPRTGSLLVVRSTDSPSGLTGVIRRTIAALDPDVAIVSSQTLEEYLASRVAGPQMAAYVTMGLALTGLFLIVVGCFALFASLVKEGMRELAVRLALGATTRRVIRHLVIQAAALTLAGLTVGLTTSLWIRRVLADQLFADSRTDPTPFWAGAALITAATLGASYLAARRVKRVDPASLLRCE